MSKYISYILSIGTILINFGLSVPAIAQLAPAIPGIVAPPALVYYRIAFVSIGKKLDKETIDGLLEVLKDEPISEKYIIAPHANKDGTYEIEMRMRIIFFDKSEAQKGLDTLKKNIEFNSDKFDLMVVEEKQL